MQRSQSLSIELRESFGVLISSLTKLPFCIIQLTVFGVGVRKQNMCFCMYFNHIYIYYHIYTNLPVDAIVRLPHPRSGDGQEMFLAPSADKQMRNYDTECSNHHPSLSTLRPKGLSRSMMKWRAIYTNLPVDAIVRLPHPWSRDSQGQETFLAPSADKQARNYDTECSNHHPSLSSRRPKGLSRSMMKW